MANFFERAPERNTVQKTFLEAIGNRRNVIASFPLNFPMVSLYAFASMLSGGLVVAVCANSRHIRRNLDYFKAAGFKFPEVAILDATQMPHEERAIKKEINHNRVRLLFTTPERFTSLSFLEILVHADLNFMVIEGADRFLPMMTGHAAYRHLQEEGLSRLRKLPPMALLVPPLPPRRLRELSEKLNLEDYQVIKEPPLIEPVSMNVKCLVTEHQKFTYLVDVLSQRPRSNQVGQLESTGSTLIQAAYPAQAEKLGASLRDYGFSAVWINHFKKSPQEQAQVLEMANNRMNAIIVNAGSDMRAWAPPAETAPRLIFWTPPAHLDDLFLQVFRQCHSKHGNYLKTPDMKALALYSKEDYVSAIKRLQNNQNLENMEFREKLSALKHYRKWVLSPGCRIQTLAAYYEGSTTTEIPPCGHCSWCVSQLHTARFGSRFVQRILQHWLF